MERNESPDPVFETDEQSTYFLTVLLINPAFSGQKSNQVSDVLSFCLQAKSRSEILENLGITNQFKNYQRHIEPLLEKGLIQMTHPESPRHRNQKYITTQKGKEYLQDAAQ